MRKQRHGTHVAETHHSWALATPFAILGQRNNNNKIVVCRVIVYGSLVGMMVGRGGGGVGKGVSCEQCAIGTFFVTLQRFLLVGTKILRKSWQPWF